LLAVESREVRREGERLVGPGGVAPGPIRQFRRGGLLAPVDVRIHESVDQLTLPLGTAPLRPVAAETQIRTAHAYRPRPAEGEGTAARLGCAPPSALDPRPGEDDAGR